MKNYEETSVLCNNIKNMATLEGAATERGVKAQRTSQNGQLDAILGRVDLLAILTTVLGIALLAVAAVVLVVFELAKLLSALWSDSFDRWLILALVLSVVWVVARWKRLCVF
jgi:hypothetical protein